MNGQERRNYIREFEQIQSRFRRKYYPSVLKGIKSVLSSLISSIKENGISTAANELQILLVNEDLTGPLLKLYKDVGVYHAKRNARLIKQDISRKGIFSDPEWLQKLMDLLKRTFLEFAVIKPTETFRNHLLQVLLEGIANESSVDEMVKLIENDSFARYQAERIVRTECGRAANTGVKISADAFEYEMEKEWIAFRDFRTRGQKPKDKKDHYHLDGVVVDYNEPFVDPKSGERIDYPQAPKGSAAMVINCRCSYAVRAKRDEHDRLIPRTNFIPRPIKM